jgi:branched-chain amino acid transport system permease protein
MIAPLIAALGRRMEPAWPLLSLIILVLLVAGTTLWVNDPEISQTVTEALIRLVVVVGMYLFIGNSGIISFGHIGFMAIGAYAAAWQTCCPPLKPTIMPGLPDFILHRSVPFLPATLIAGTLTALVALVVGFFIMRLSGVGASIATFALLAIVEIVYSNWDRVTAGTGAVIGIPVVVTVPVATCACLAALIIAYGFQVSPCGLSLRSSRDDEIAARAAGVDVFRQRLIALVLSAFLVGFGGALYSHFLGILSPDIFYLNLAFVTLAMLVVGGVGSLAGAVVGVLVVSAAIEVLRRLEVGMDVAGMTISLPPGSQEVLLGILMLLVLVFRNRGLTGSREISWPRRPSSYGLIDKGPVKQR